MKSIKEMTDKLYGSRYFDLAAFGLIVVLVLAAYSNSFTSSFHFDDSPAISDNAMIKQVSLGNIMAAVFSSRPVVYLSLMLNYRLSGLNVIGYHIFNVGLHAANSFLVFLFILRTLTTPALKPRFGGRAKWMALFGSLLFAVHPVQTESVTYIITRSELLGTFFYLGAILLFISAVQTDKWKYYAAAFFSAVLAMASKEWAVTLPAVIFLYDYLILSNGNLRTVLSRWGIYVLIMLSWWVAVRNLDLFSAGSSVGFNMSTSDSAASGPRKAVTIWTYSLTSCNVIWTYIRLLFVPVQQNIDYDYPVATTLTDLHTLLSVAGHLAVVAGAFWLYLKKKQVLLPFAVAWFYITLSPVQSIVPLLDVIFEHRLYLPSIGFFLAFVVLYEKLFAWLEQRDVPAEVSWQTSASAIAGTAALSSQTGRKISRKAARRAKKQGTPG